jgi:hypothetical protein
MGRQVIHERICTGRFARWMRRRGWGGVCLPLPFVTVILYWVYATSMGKAHEGRHAEQAARMGWLWWWLVYAYETARRGYWNNRLEVDARDHAERLLKDAWDV